MREPHIYEVVCPVTGEKFRTVSSLRRFKDYTAKSFYHYYKNHGESDDNIKKLWATRKGNNPKESTNGNNKPKKVQAQGSPTS